MRTILALAAALALPALAPAQIPPPPGLVEEGKLAWDQPVIDVLPWFRIRGTATSGSR